MNVKDVNVIVSSIGSVGSTTFGSYGEIKDVKVTHNRTNGKNEVEVKVNDKVIFKYDSNRKDCYIKNNIQTPYRVCDTPEEVVGINNAIITEARIITATISDTNKSED